MRKNKCLLICNRRRKKASWTIYRVGSKVVGMETLWPFYPIPGNKYPTLNQTLKVENMSFFLLHFSKDVNDAVTLGIPTGQDSVH